MVLRTKGIVFLVLALSALSVAQQNRPDLNAFVNQRVRTTAELVNHVRSDSSVMDRFMRHFGMSREEVLQFLGTLRPGRLQTDGIYSIYSVPEGGYIKVRQGVIRAGTAMFMDAAGNPILVALCGNPVVRGPERTIANVEPGTTEPTVALREIPVDGPPLSDEVLMNLLPTLPEIPERSPEPQIFAPSTGALAGLAGIGAFALFSSPPGAPIPEPTTMVALGIGAVALMRRRKKS